MCGIVGVLSPHPVEKNRLEKALSSLHKRGPDGRGLWWSEDGRVGLGQARLAINDSAGGGQPLVSEDFVASVNGEFYDLPTAYQGLSDSLALPRFVRDHGLDGALERLRGEFAFLLYDRRERALVVGRDRFGIKPLYWSKIGQQWWFASKVSALWAAGLPAGWCPRSFAHAAATQYPPAGESLFAGVHSLKPAHFLVLKDFQARVARYWQVPDCSAEGSPEGPATDLFEELQTSVRLRLRSGSETAVLLSGGVDSASILALAAEEKERIKAYTIDFEGLACEGFSEAALAADQAARLGVSHRVISLSSEEILARLARVVADTEGLCVNGHSVGKWKLSEAVRDDGIKVLLTGEGADELFFGYRHFRGYFGPTDQEDILRDPAGLGILVTPKRPSPLPADWPAFFLAKYSLGQKILSFLNLKADPVEEFQRVLDALCVRASPLERARDAWLDTALRSYILEVLGDGTEMAHSVEGRPPFLDHRLWERCSLTSLSQQDGSKSQLRTAMRGFVHEKILNRPKHPFMAPPLGERLYAALEERFSGDDHPYIDTQGARKNLHKIRRLGGRDRWEWEPALLWILSSYYLQDSWTR